MKFKYCMSMNKDPTKLHEENNEIFVFRETGVDISDKSKR